MVLPELRRRSEGALFYETSVVKNKAAEYDDLLYFLPPTMAAGIAAPNLISVLMDNPNSIFVIDDDENIVINLEPNGNSPVSALLNISDGLLSDCLNIQIICSFNTDLSKGDTALLRKGRLIARYEFKELEIHVFLEYTGVTRCSSHASLQFAMSRLSTLFGSF